MTRSARYGGSCFEAASALPLGGGLGRPRRLVAFATALRRRPSNGAALLRLLAETRSERFQLSNSPAGRALARYFDERFLGVFPKNRLCRGVLLLPHDHDHYLRGRSRQALRTNLRRAALAGIRCGIAIDPVTAITAARDVLERRRAAITEEDRANLTSAWPALFARVETALLVARNPSGQPLAVIAALIDDDICLIHVAVASDHDARWALHDHLVRILIGRGVRYLLAEGDGPFGALGFDAGMRHYQHLLGYELRHLAPSTRQSSPRMARSQHLSPAHY
ncbi:MAG: hypothetical protein JO027_09125 [Solirubrobacterales bacterium]|nr:hypothetical protein [Solirubrobacterales bacterium]